VIGRVALVLLAALAAGSTVARAAGDPPPGATGCSGCHSPAGKAATAIPPITGRDEKELVTEMEAFREGKRPATVMTRLMKGFTPEEMRAIAAWLAAQK
jgi:sulfide dehydrogenase cytochrome subunit